ncbi:hypothetical protein Cni_G11925 [Canna indica]|uniref:Uncharacterized protein n=1 Tax=Canna indica TaxID=4628 RepID=A0AAQ3K781_9LILI|nr:hypothetical protein Cni_G11925 [Canna indica]
MASQGTKSFTSFLLFINLLMYAVVAMIAGWALNYGINETPLEASHLRVPARLFPIYYPIGNMATGFFVIFSLIAGIVGVATSLTGLQDVCSWRAASLLSASASSIITWGLTLLAMGEGKKVLLPDITASVTVKKLKNKKAKKFMPLQINTKMYTGVSIKNLPTGAEQITVSE